MTTNSRARLRHALMLLGLLCLAVAPGMAKPAATTTLTLASAADDARAELERIEQSITLSRQRADKLRAEMEEIKADPSAQNAALIAAAQRVKMAEIEVNNAEERLAKLLSSESEIRERLDGTDTEISNLLAVLQRIGRTPPPALIVKPDDALGAARGATLLAAALPQLRQRADQVSADLDRMVALREAAETEKTQLKANLETLEEERLRIATLLEARRQASSRVGTALAEEEKQAAALAEKATSLNQLIDTLTARLKKASDAAAAAATPGGPKPALSPEEVKTALADTSRTEPAFPFNQARGYLALPAAGVKVVDYGVSDGFGGISSGISMLTRQEAQIVAPADGWVVYQGPYLNYGKIVIINPGEGYSILLAGLDKTNVRLGQFVLRGEPIATMGKTTTNSAIATSAGVSRPTLYIELRNEKGPIDPTGWWAIPDNQTQSG